MFEHRDVSGRQFRTYEVDAEDFSLFEGDMVPEGCEIGIDVRTGMAIYLGQEGIVATVYYNPMNHSFLVMFQLKSAETAGTGKREMVPA
ncbi:MAG: hypothetical protein JXA46_02030 [Dehalococcoidales bacterium]|nr:hypothetical protein [Dehalococcoidales bacterium]